MGGTLASRGLDTETSPRKMLTTDDAELYRYRCRDTPVKCHPIQRHGCTSDDQDGLTTTSLTVVGAYAREGAGYPTNLVLGGKSTTGELVCLAKRLNI